MSIKFSKNSITKPNHRQRFAEVVGDQNVAVNCPLADLLPIGIGGVVDYFVTVKTSQQLVDVAKLAIELRLPYQLVAGGTACLPSEVGFPGLVINNQADSLFFDDQSGQVLVESGASNLKLVTSAASRSLGGVEFLAAIPGSIGGALATSAAYEGKTIRNQCLKEILLFVPDLSGGRTITLPTTELSDSPYRSVFSTKAGFQPIILTARLQLARISQTEIFKRLKQLRRAARETRAVTFADFFCQVPELNKDLRLPKPPEGVKYSLKRPNTLIIQKRKDMSSSAIRAFIEQLSKDLCPGSRLDVRLTYLGYWPKDEEPSANTEGF